MSNTTSHTGTKYNADLDVAQIAKLIRKDLKAAGYKVSVRISRYSMGQSINVDVKAFPASFELSTLVEFVDNGSDDMNWYRPCKLDAVKEIVNAYNDSDSDAQTDYYRTNFFAHVDMDRDLTDAATEAAIAKTATRGQIEMLASLGL